MTNKLSQGCATTGSDFYQDVFLQIAGEIYLSVFYLDGQNNVFNLVLCLTSVGGQIDFKNVADISTT